MTSTAPDLRGRRAESTRLEQVVAGVRSGDGQVLIVRGEAGIGKSALLDYLVDRAEGCRVVRAAGVESEMELPFAGLHQLCLPFLDLTGRLPGPQRAALEVAFGLSVGGPPDRFLIGAATLSLLSAASDREPLLCVVDDAQWLDQSSAQTLSFVGRRLFADQIGLVFAVREPVTGPQWRGFAELPIPGLADEYAGALLDSVVPGRLDAHVRDRIVAETRGNPLALLELPRGLTATQLAGGFERPDARPLASQIEQNFARRVRALPEDSQRLLLTAAADSVGDVPLLVRALALLGVPMSAAAPAEAAGLIDIAARVRFRHPLIRSATYRTAEPAQRRAAHQALAEATDPELDPDRRAWHRAQGADGPDEDVAADLVSSADRAQRRGGVAASAAFLQRATELTPDPATRSVRALAAAQVSLAAGAFETAIQLLHTAEHGPADDALHQARVNLLRAQLTFASGHSREAPPLLLEAARRLVPLDLGLARDTYLEAFSAAAFAGRFGGETDLVRVAQAAKSVPRVEVPRKRDLLYDASAALFGDSYAAAVAPAQAAMTAFSGLSKNTTGRTDEDDLPWMWLAAGLAVHLWDEENWELLSARHLRIARELGDLNQLPLVIHHRVLLSLFEGELATAAALLAEVRPIHEATGVGLASYGDICLAAWSAAPDAGSMIAASLEDSEARGEGGAVAFGLFADALLHNGLAQYAAALRSGLEAIVYPAELGPVNWALPEVIEAAARAGRPQAAAEAYDLLREQAEASGTDWVRGVLARATGLRSKGQAAETAYQESAELLCGTRMRMELARTHLVFGEWLRREGRKQDARGKLRSAYKLFAEAGASGFAERAAKELAATGEAVDQRRTADGSGRDALTAQEARIADLAGSGLTNAEIGAQLFLSQHTVEWHLRKVFAKLGITSRRQLRP